mgnify:CR=1 FL=1
MMLQKNYPIHNLLLFQLRQILIYIIESVNNMLKNTCQIEHSRHRSFDNFISNMISELITYSFLPKNPSIKTPNMLPNKSIT